jgi:hypothetical protein
MTHAGTGQHNGAPVPPLPVHITNAQELAGMGARKGPRKHVRSVFRTFALTSTNLLYPILAEDLARLDTWVCAYGNSVVLCESQSQAQDPANQIAGTGVFANTPANPQGTLLYVPSGATFVGMLPPPVSAWVRLRTTEPVWATALAFPTMVSIITQDCVEGY